MAHDVFISYSSKDKQAADAVCARLESEGIKCWIAPRDIPPSARYAQSIISGINASRLMIFIFSSHSNASGHVESEIDRAYNKHLPIIPLRIEDVAMSGSLEYYLSTAQWFDALTPPLDAHLERLPGVVRQLLDTNIDAAPAAVTTRPSPAALPPPKSSNFFGSKWFKITAGLVLIGLIAASVFLWQRQRQKTENPAAVTNNAGSSSGATVVDPETDIMWTKTDNGAPINWDEAVKYCDDLSLGGFDDWRLPSKLDFMATNDSDIPKPNRIWKSLQLKTDCCYWASNQEGEDHALAFNVTEEIVRFEKANRTEKRALCIRHSEK